MDPTKVKLRVHIVPVGFELDRISEAAVNMKADRVWLITNKGEDKAKEFTREIEKRLTNNNIEFSTETVDIIDLYDVLYVMRTIVEKEFRNDIFINVSSGSKIEAIAGMLTSSIFHNLTDITPYYVIPKKYTAEPEITKPISRGFKDVTYLPDYHIDRPEQDMIDLLKIIGESRNGNITKKKLIEKATIQGLITVRGKNILQSQYASLNANFLNKMKVQNLVTESADRRSKTVTITEAGKNMLKFLG